ncbi:MAG: sulfatase [Candidatus Sumerlaeota bacterium]|nr:sulfatase [Candidatus Sumerlaeota bacterium]
MKRVPIILQIAMAVGALLWLAAPRSVAAEAAAAVGKPNVVLIVVDDMGYVDIGCYGCKDIPTPNIDSLARDGVKFTNGYVSCSYCSPTRAGIQTGRYQERFGHEFNPGSAEATKNDPAVGLLLTEITLADMLKKAGYATGIVGKWHLGAHPQFHPMKRGYDEFFGFLGGSHSYVKWDDKGDPILRGTEPAQGEGYLTTRYGQEAAEFIQRHKDAPYYLYLAFNAVHSPLEADEEHLAKFAGIQDKKRRTYAAMLSAMDDAIGQVLQAVKDTGQEKNTIVWFVDDNGGPLSQGSDNGTLKGKKSQPWEGGIRVPFMVRYPEKLKGGVVYDKPVISLDIAPTSVAEAGGELPKDRPIDGVDLIPYLRGEKQGVPHEELYWRKGPDASVRKGDMKLVRQGGAGKYQFYLYDLGKDRDEKQDLAAEKPDVVKQLTADLANWEKDMKPPLWSPQAKKPKKSGAAASAPAGKGAEKAQSKSGGRAAKKGAAKPDEGKAKVKPQAEEKE